MEAMPFIIGGAVGLILLVTVIASGDWFEREFKYAWYIIRHKWFVFLECGKRGLVWRGITHDLSKLRPSEWAPYADYFYGPELPSIKDTHGEEQNAVLGSLRCPYRLDSLYPHMYGSGKGRRNGTCQSHQYPKPERSWRPAGRLGERRRALWVA